MTRPAPWKSKSAVLRHRWHYVLFFLALIGEPYLGNASLTTLTAIVALLPWCLRWDE